MTVTGAGVAPGTGGPADGVRAAGSTAVAGRDLVQESTRRVRAVVLATLACITTTLTLSPLFQTSSWLAPTLVTLTAVGLCAIVTAVLRGPGIVVVIASAVAGLVVTTALFAPGRALLGGFVPTADSVGDLVDLATGGLTTSRTVIAPVEPAVELTALLSVSMAAVLVAVIAIAAWLGHPGVAGLPLLLVAFVAAALAPRGIGLAGFVVAGAGFLLLALTDADARVREWGPLLRRRSAPVSSAVVGSFAGPAALTAVTALVAAAIIPALVPGLSRSSLSSVVQDTFGNGGVDRLDTQNPFLNLRDDLTQPEDVEVITYSTDDTAPDPLRIVTADVFDGQSWQPAAATLSADRTVDRGLPLPQGATAASLQNAPLVRTDIDVTRLNQRYLPLPYPAATVDIDGEWLYDAETLNVVSRTTTTLGQRYLVNSYDVRPEPAVLQAAAAAPPEVSDRYTQLPDGLPPVVTETAAQVTVGAATAYDRAVALQQFFREDGGFVYSLDAPDSGGSDVLAAFLAERSGYCVQYASAMAVMARTLGIPARVGVGFLPGEATGAGVYSISIRDAHAWPELYFEGTGWVRFEPTPSTRTGQSPTWTTPQEAGAQPSAAPSVAPSTAPAPQPAPARDIADDPQGGPDTSRGAPAGVLAVTVGVVLLLALVTAPLVRRRLRDDLRWRRAQQDPRAAADAAWVTMAERVSDLGWRWGEGSARSEAGALVTAWEPATGGREALGRLVGAVERGRFAATPAPADGLREDVTAVVASLARDRSWQRRWRARLWPAPVPRPWGGPPRARGRGRRDVSGEVGGGGELVMTGDRDSRW